jgi:serine protease Do
MANNKNLWICIAFLAVLNLFTLAYLFYSTDSTDNLVSSLGDRISRLENELSIHQNQQAERMTEIEESINETSDSLDNKISSLENDLNGRIDGMDTRILDVYSGLARLTQESEELTGKVSGLENVSKGIDIEDLKNAVVIVEVDGKIVGSGTIFDEEGYVITNKHVIENAGVIRIELFSGKRYKASVIAESTSKMDLAILKLQGTGYNLTKLEFENLENIRTGGEVYAIGNPLGEELTKFTVTEGIISGFREENGVQYVQTDAALNPGSSGGPLIDTEGKVVGIVRMGYIQAEGLSFAIRSDFVQGFIDEEMP